MKKILIIIADKNDCEYDTTINIIDEKIELKIQPLIEAIKNFEFPKNLRTNYPTGDCVGDISAYQYYVEIKNIVSKEVFELFNKYVPRGSDNEGEGIHTIKGILIIEGEIKEMINIFKSNINLKESNIWFK